MRWRPAGGQGGGHPGGGQGVQAVGHVRVCWAARGRPEYLMGDVRLK